VSPPCPVQLLRRHPFVSSPCPVQLLRRHPLLLGFRLCPVPSRPVQPCPAPHLPAPCVPSPPLSLHSSSLPALPLTSLPLPFLPHPLLCTVPPLLSPRPLLVLSVPTPPPPIPIFPFSVSQSVPFRVVGVPWRPLFEVRFTLVSFSSPTVGPRCICHRLRCRYWDVGGLLAGFGGSGRPLPAGWCELARVDYVSPAAWASRTTQPSGSGLLSRASRVGAVFGWLACRVLCPSSTSEAVRRGYVCTYLTSYLSFTVARPEWFACKLVGSRRCEGRGVLSTVVFR